MVQRDVAPQTRLLHPVRSSIRFKLEYGKKNNIIKSPLELFRGADDAFVHFRSSQFPLVHVEVE